MVLVLPRHRPRKCSRAMAMRRLDDMASSHQSHMVSGNTSTGYRLVHKLQRRPANAVVIQRDGATLHSLEALDDRNAAVSTFFSDNLPVFNDKDSRAISQFDGAPRPLQHPITVQDWAPTGPQPEAASRSGSSTLHSHCAPGPDGFVSRSGW